MDTPRSKRWLALIVLCLATLMIVLDTTIVNVALPSIKASLGFSDTSLAWVVNAYALTFAGFLLLGGRLGDLYGQRRLFLVGIVVFTLSSLLCGIAGSQLFLIAARAVQGIGGAIASAISLSIVMNLFQEPKERTEAMGIFGFVAAGGGSVGALLGGLLTGAFNWHWIFLVNLPIGIIVFVASLYVLSGHHARAEHVHLDVWGALFVTASLMLLVYGIVNGNVLGWMSLATLGTIGAGIVLMIIFVLTEARVRSPLVPLTLFRLRSIVVANTAGVLWSAAMFAWFFLSALYMQLVLSYAPMQVGLAFVPANLIMAIFSVWLSAKVVTRFGPKRPLALGLFLVAAGLLLFARVPVVGNFWWDILPPMLLMGFGAGMSFNPMLLIAMSEVKEHESGLASGVVNTAFMMGGSLGLAILASVAASRTGAAFTAGMPQVAALTSGYNAAFLVGGIFALSASALIAFGIKSPSRSHGHAVAQH